MRTLTVGTRNSKLALIQTNWVIDKLREAGVDNPIHIKEIVTKGDRRLDVSLPELGGRGVFLEEIEAQLLEGDIDFAVHSLKDIPAWLPDGLMVASIPEREDYRDAYLANDHVPFHALPKGAVIGTSSLRRAAQLLRERPDIRTKWIRGPIDSRMKQMQQGDFDAIILAVAGIKRLGMGVDMISEYLPAEKFVPAPGQGALAIECCTADKEVSLLLRQINHVQSEHAALTERAFMSYFEDGEAAPVGGYAQIIGDHIAFHGMIISVDGKTVLEHISSGDDPEKLAKEMAEVLIGQGALDILQAAKEENNRHGN